MWSKNGTPVLEVLDQHLAGDLVLTSWRDREVDLEEAVRVAVEHGRNAVFDQQRDIFEPVEILARCGGDKVDAVDEGDVFLVWVSATGKLLGIDPGLDRDPAARIAEVCLRAHQLILPLSAMNLASMPLISLSVRSSVRPGM